jgi:anaerobic magnesium-protoporphyrin IX monomethyl ester cyclase
MDKGTTIKQIEDSTKLLQQKEVRVAFFIQYGYLGEEKEDIDKTIALIKRLKPDDIGISVSYPLPGTKFYDKVKDELEGKQNWTDSDELAMLFKGTFNQQFYKKLHRYTHKTFQVTKGRVALKRLCTKPFKTSVSQLKQIAKMPIYYVLSKKENLELKKMRNLYKL